MRFLLDENAPFVLVDLLAARGHDVVAMVRVGPSDSDAMVLERARQQQRIIVTLDLDFGTLIYRDRAVIPPGVVQFRGRPSEVQIVIARFIALLDEGTDLSGAFVVIDPDGKVRRLPLTQD